MNAGVPWSRPGDVSSVAPVRPYLVGLILHDPEVEHFQVVVLGAQPADEEIRGLDVAVHEAVLVRLGKRPARLAEEHDHPLRRLRSEAVDDVLQVEPLQQLHDVVEGAGVVDAEVVELHGMRRPQPRRHLRFALETADQLFARGARRRFLPNQLDRRGTGEEPVLRQPDFAHAAGSQPRDQTIAADSRV